MSRPSAYLLALATTVTLAVVGCALRKDAPTFWTPEDMRRDRVTATRIEYPDVQAPIRTDLSATPPPLSLAAGQPPPVRNIALQEAVQMALMNSQVMRDLGGTLLRSPDLSPTVYGPAVIETDPRFGVDATLAAFDAEFSTSAFFEANHRALNNQFFGGGTRLLQQNAYVFQNQIAKTAATGTRFALRHNSDYDQNNAPGNIFPAAWNTNFEAEFRHPLLQGAGVEYNRIAGPGGVPGLPNGVLVARLRTDVSLAEFEQGVRSLCSDVENTYWDLYFAYRDLDAKIAARNVALETWRRVQSLNATGRRGGEAEKEAHAREQYFRFEEEVQNALAGTPVEGTRNNNGSSGGTFRGTGGVQVVERRLRLLIGLPITDGELLRPSEEPRVAQVTFDWEGAVAEALARRVELRRQRWILKRRELELVAARAYLLPTFDTIGRYRLRGFGQKLFGAPGAADFDNAWGNLATGAFQEYQAGLEFSMPLGFRRGHAAVRNAEYNIARERAVLQEQERQVVHDLSTALAEKDRAYVVVQTNFNRRQAALQQLDATQAAYDADKAPLDFVLEAQRVVADATTRYQRALVEYALSLKNVHFEKGSLLDYNGVALAEGPWPGKAYSDAARRESLRGPIKPLNYGLASPPTVSLPMGTSGGGAIFNGPPMGPIEEPVPTGQPLGPPPERLPTPPAPSP